MACPVRKYLLTQPKNWVPPVPRWQLKLPDEVEEIFTTYVGVQQHTFDEAAKHQAIDEIEKWLSSTTHKPAVIDRFVVQEGFDIPKSRVWVAYWTNRSSWKGSKTQLNLSQIYTSLPPESRSSTGLWLETFTTPVARLETNYAGLHHRPGLGSLPDTERTSHTLTAYWGAARDRMPASAYDLYSLPPSPETVKPPTQVPRGIGQRLRGHNYDNIVHIRSGQIWTSCPADEASAYESTLEPVLMEGMRHLWSNPVDTGTVGLRFLRNLDPESDNSSSSSSVKTIDETCGAGFFRNLSDLEQWAKRHKTHLAIFNGAHRHAKEWGEGRKFMTWHEVSVLKAGEAMWEYVNCAPETGVIRWIGMDSVEELEDMKYDGELPNENSVNGTV